jgi:3-deoxy-D-manno-octulosonate 8-phosphate phosphatase (KDO 8-P phosphatase)
LIAGELAARAREVRLLVLDADGVLTDGSVYYTGRGEAVKRFHIRDGLGIKLLLASGVQIAVITGRRSRALETRARELGVAYLQQGVEDKLAAFTSVLENLGLGAARAAAIGDDLPDLPVLARCALAVAVPEAPELVRGRVHYVTRAPGGRGAVREVCELIMHAQRTFDAQVRSYLQ